jgi:hypothetical protein
MESCVLCGLNPSEYGHFYYDEGRVENYHVDQEWCFACMQSAREKSVKVFAEIHPNLGENVPSFCPMKGCGVIMLYEDGLDLGPLVKKVSKVSPASDISFLKTKFVSKEGKRILVLETKYLGKSVRAEVVYA